MKFSVKPYENRAVFANEMLDKYFSKAPNKVVSDIGAGYGHMKQKIDAIGAEWQPFDYYQKIESSTIWDLNNKMPKTAKKAGTAIFLEVLEHLANPLLSLQHIADHIVDGGYLILTTPNPQSSKNIINLALKGTLFAFQEKHLEEHHVFTPWEHIVRFFLENTGFEILEYAVVDTAYTKRKRTSIKDGLKFFLERFLEKRNPKAKGMSYGLVAIKK
ncbi:methyltransferase domain-containing protein [Flavobacteriaceae sp. LMIT009]